MNISDRETSAAVAIRHPNCNACVPCHRLRFDAFERIQMLERRNASHIRGNFLYRSILVEEDLIQMCRTIALCHTHRFRQGLGMVSNIPVVIDLEHGVMIVPSNAEEVAWV